MPLRASQLFGTGPVLPVPDVAEACAFYRDCLGFELDFTMGDPPDHGSVTRCKVGVQFSRFDGAFRPRDYPGYTYVFVDDVDALHREYADRGVTITRAPESFDYGMREFEIEDGNGYRLRFGQYLEG